MNRETNMNPEMKIKPTALICSACLACLVVFGLLGDNSVQAQGVIVADHLYAGAVGTAYDDQLIWANAAAFSTNAGYYPMGYSAGGQWAGYYNSEPTMAVLAATAAFGGPSSLAPALGSFIQAKIFLVSAPEGGQFGFWEAGSTAPTYNLNVSEISPLIPLSGGADNPDAGTFGVDPYGHIDGRRFSATVPGDYIVGLQLIDTDDNGLDGLPIHSPSDILYVNFRAGALVPEPGTMALMGLGLGALGLGAGRRLRSQPHSSPRCGRTRTKPAVLRGARTLAGNLPLVAACLFAGNMAEAHLTYSGRDFGSFSGLTNGLKAITNQTVTGNYGWADAADGVLGDSHRGRGFRFHLDNAAFVSLTVSSNASATATSLGGLNPAFSLYSGLAAVAPLPPSQTTNAASSDHDFGAASVAWRIWWVQQHINPSATDESPTDGSWNAVGDWKMGGDGDLPGDFSQLSSFNYQGSAAATGGANTVTGSFALPAGDYTIMIGGNDIANKTSDTALSAYGIAAILSVTPTPTITIAPKVFVAWPSGILTNWVLQFASSINATNWTSVTNAPVIVDGQPGVVLGSDAAGQYFRLRYVP